ncbi:ankyrin repeat-containing domain protein [Aspergillus varians]
MPLLNLPNEILLLVAGQIGSEHDISSFTKTCQCLHSLLSDFLYRNNIQCFNSSALVWGVRHDRPDIVKRMLDLGADVDATEDDQTILETAACYGRLALVKLLLDRGASYPFMENRPRTPLCAAAAGGHADVVKIFLDRDESEQDAHGITSLPGREQDILLHQLFIAQGLNPPGKQVQYTIPLFMAIAGSHDAIAVMLIKSKKANLNYRDSFHRTPLLWAISHGRDRVVSSLLENSADSNLEDPGTQQSPLLMAVTQGNKRVAKLLLRYDVVDPNWRDGRQQSPLFEALRSPLNQEVLHSLIARSDLDVNRRDREGVTPLSFAVRNGYIDAVKLLLGHPAIDVDAPCIYGRTALSHAAESFEIPLIDLLLAKGADPTLKDLVGREPSSYAATSYRPEGFLRLFQTEQVQLEARDSRGWTPLFYACNFGRPEMVKLLLDLGASPNAQDTAGETPLMWAMKRSRRIPPDGADGIIRFLLAKGADPNVKDHRGATALCWALDYDIFDSNKEPVKVLFAPGCQPWEGMLPAYSREVSTCPPHVNTISPAENQASLEIRA